METVILCALLLFFSLIGFVVPTVLAYYKLVRPLMEKVDNPLMIPPSPVNVEVDMGPFVREVQRIPAKVLQSVQGSVNANKGVLGELISVIKLRAEYDRIIPISNIVDFICIRLPTETREGTVDFVEVKSGKARRLTNEQKQLQKLLEDKKVQFVKVEVETTIEANK